MYKIYRFDHQYIDIRVNMLGEFKSYTGTSLRL